MTSSRKRGAIRVEPQSGATVRDEEENQAEVAPNGQTIVLL